MPALNKQTLINLLIDSPLREPIKINLIDIVNNTNDADLPKTYSTIAKELEIYQKATERRMKLAEETIAKLQSDGGAAPTPDAPLVTPATTTPTESPALPPLPPLPAAPAPLATPAMAPVAEQPGLSVPPLDLPPLPTMKSAEPAPATPEPVATAPVATPTPSAASSSADEDALKEIQKELDALKSSAVSDASPAPAAPQA